jgi:hypothetical protein
MLPASRTDGGPGRRAAGSALTERHCAIAAQNYRNEKITASIVLE